MGQVITCAGCGAKIQSERKDALGYVPASAVSREPVVCQRCFRIKHYNEVSTVALDESDFLRILGHIGTQRALVVHIVDLFDFEGSIISGLPRFVGHNSVLLVGNKVDLFPKNVNRNRILNWMQMQAKEAGLKPADTVVCSARSGEGFERLIELIDEYRRRQDVYIVGATNVGKSSLINRLIRDFSEMDAELTVSRYPGTTLDMVHIPLDDGKAVIDTPGIVYKSRLTELIGKADLAAITPDKPLKPLVYQLNAEQTLFFGALARFDFVKGEHQSFTCYVASGLKVHRTKLERADALYQDHRGAMLQPPSAERLAELPEWTKHAIRIPRGGGKDILISGLGFIKANSEAGAEVVIHAPRGVKVVLRDALL